MGASSRSRGKIQSPTYRYDVEAEDEREPIGRGTHERFVVDLDRFLKRVADKAGL